MSSVAEPEHIISIEWVYESINMYKTEDLDLNLN